MYYALNRSQSNASAFKLASLVQALKHAEQFVRISHIKAHSVVPHEYYQVICVSVGAADLDFGLRARARELDRVGNKVNQHKPQHRTVSIEIGQ
jgi:hypothetical protein